MAFCYDDEAKRGPFNGKLPDDAVKMYLGHYKNFLFLTFMSEKGNMVEKAQARKELEVCHRKMDFWQKHPNWNTNEALPKIEKLKKDWGS